MAAPTRRPSTGESASPADGDCCQVCRPVPRDGDHAEEEGGRAADGCCGCWARSCGCSRHKQRKAVVAARVLFAVGITGALFLSAFLVYEVIHRHAERHVVAWVVSAICCALAVLISFHTIALHVLSYVNPPVQACYIRMIWMVPIYAVESWLSLRFKNYAIYWETARESYEAYVIWTLFQLLTILLVQHQTRLARAADEAAKALEGSDAETGGHGSSAHSAPSTPGTAMLAASPRGSMAGVEMRTGPRRVSRVERPEGMDAEEVEEVSRLASLASARRDLIPHALDEMPSDEEVASVIRMIGETEGRTHAHHITPFCCLPKWTLGMNFLHRTRWGVFQYVVLRISCTIVAFATELTGHLGEGEFQLDVAYPYIAFVINASQLWAIYCLVLFLHEFMAHFPASSKPIWKLGLVKAVVFVTFWQAVAVAGLSYLGYIQATLDYTKEDIVRGVNDLLITVEMFLAAIAHEYIFPAREVLAFDDFDIHSALPDARRPHRAILDMVPLDVMLTAHRIMDPRRRDSLERPLTSPSASSPRAPDDKDVSVINPVT